MSRPVGSHNTAEGSRELYYQNLVEMQRECVRLGRSFPNEMIVLTERWLEKHREPDPVIPHEPCIDQNHQEG